jgi:hypothetical protein
MYVHKGAAEFITVKSKTAHRLFGGKKKRTKSFGETLRFTDKFHYQESVAVY